MYKICINSEDNLNSASPPIIGSSPTKIDLPFMGIHVIHSPNIWKEEINPTQILEVPLVFFSFNLIY